MNESNVKDKFGIGENVILSGKDGINPLSLGMLTRPIRTKVVVKNNKTGESWVGHNKTMLAGSEFMAMSMFNLPHDTYITPSYNSLLGLDNTVYVDRKDMDNMYCCCLWAMGNSGAPAGTGIHYEVINKWPIKPDDLIPFQYVPYDNDLTPEYRSIYFGRKALTDKKMVAYYFKKFDSDPTLIRQLEDGTPLQSSVYDDTSELAAQCFVSLSLSITKTDGRDYYINTTGINEARFNSIELLMGWTRTINGFSYYQDLRPVTRINLPNKFLSDLGASWNVQYTLYF